ncbi:hypothetical protein WAI453_004557 [Rhynchosporium graminicola]|uniref:Uncharacterized protein n=1 Tax=Rhynchosporium graminicola TaxID=2792576 RepID=A0A1E1LLS8_9HELO|nr:uncharacterized protein RCO7_03851 [Rhynchosporium commune]
MHVGNVSRSDSLATLMTTASTPATPGPSTPTNVRSVPLNQLKVDEIENGIVPPARPKSTPFPHQDLMDGNIQSPQRLFDVDSPNPLQSTYGLYATQHIQRATSVSPLKDLPVEIHECVLDYLFGVRASASSRTAAAGNTKVLRNWGTALRHSRRREVSILALVSKQWRVLVQDRLYRHLKIKGTRESVNLANLWFTQHQHLCCYVKHIEIWFPVFQPKNPAFDRTLRIPSTTPDRSVVLRSLGSLVDTGFTITYQSPSNNCTLEEVFRFVGMTFGEACILTLEGGERKKPPMVRHHKDPATSALPIIDTIRTLVCKGQWNLIRSDDDFQNIVAALPNLSEWHASYAKPKSKSYISMATILPKLPQNLTHLNVCLEADYRREAVSPAFSRKAANVTHLCAEMAKAIPTLEHLSYTGRVCFSFFDQAAKLSDPRNSRLKSVDIVVKNVCRPAGVWNDGSGITDAAFIAAFERLVISGIKSLDKLAALQFLRIRFLDLDSQVPALNPYFQLLYRQCTGLWSDEIVEALKRARPATKFIEKPDDLCEFEFKDGQLRPPPTFSKTKPLSIKVSSYLTLSRNDGITIH